jgi:DNA-binding NtrC family response regulator
MHILIIGSLGGALGTAARMAISKGARLEQADDVTTAMVRLRANSRIEVALCDIGQDIAGLIEALRSERMSVPVVACGANVSPDTAARAIRSGAREFIELPPTLDLIAGILEAVSADHHLLVARDAVMLELVRRADQFAGAEASILISGESGTGKEVLAHHVHRRSRRAGGPFVALNCAAIPENLLESELFGHEKGAFSGATARRIGKFEAADGGTLLLDEISEMDVRLQAKLLRTIQEREVDRLGGTAPVKINVRILATTNRDLKAEVAKGHFREDLYFRLNVVSLHVPPLRSRPADITALADHFARRYAEANGMPFRPIGEAARYRLLANPWRGNVRELENVIHRAVLLSDGDTIDTAAIELTQDAPPSTENSTLPSVPIGTLVGRRIEDVERDLIIETLQHTLGNRTHAATILGISIRALRNKIRDYSAQGLAVTKPQNGAFA